MVRWLYGVLMGWAQPLLRRKLARRARQEEGYGHAVQERFGHYSGPAWPGDGRTLWVHAVSLGETRAAAVLLGKLRQQWPEARLLLTHGTATGRAEGAALLRPGDAQAWLPWDTPQAVSRFLTHFQPRLGLLMETEVWPNLVAACKQARVPLVLANARLSEKSLRQARRLAWLAQPAYRGLHAVWAQTPEDARRLAALGAVSVEVLGNVKFDATPDAVQLGCGQAWRAHNPRPVVMFASSREGEEQALLDVLKRLPEAWTVQWLIVPRHPQRFDAVATLVQAQGLTLSRRSQWAQAPDMTPAQVWLGDSLGEMAMYYGLSDAALLGGSFAPLGGQNLIEAAACACPVLMGPYTFNFSQAADLAVAAQAASRHADLTQAVQAALNLVHQPEQRARVAEAARQFALAHQGATTRTVAQVLRLLGQQGVDRL